jgi:hypothetical protein
MSEIHGIVNFTNSSEMMSSEILNAIDLVSYLQPDGGFPLNLMPFWRDLSTFPSYSIIGSLEFCFILSVRFEQRNSDLQIALPAPESLLPSFIQHV